MKKKLALVLSVMLVLTCVFALAACQEPGITVEYRSDGEKLLHSYISLDGTVSEMYRAEKPGYVFGGWYTAERATDAEGNESLKYADTAFDFSKTYTKDVTLFAKYTKNAQGFGAYIVAGALTIPTEGPSWNPNPAVGTMMVYDSVNGLYTKTFTVGGGFRVMKANGGWGSDYNFSHVKNVTIATGVTLPTDVTAANLLVDGGGGDRNIEFNAALSTFNIRLTLTLDIPGNSLTINILEVTAKPVDPAPAA